MILQGAYLLLSVGILFSSAPFNLFEDTSQLLEMTETESAENGSEKESEKEEKAKEKEPKTFSEATLLMFNCAASVHLQDHFYHQFNTSVFREVLTPPPDVC